MSEVPKSESAAEDEADVREEAEQSLKPMDFSTFVLSLASTAMVHMGIVEHSEKASSQVDLQAAKQLVDIIGVLEQKTRNNLSETEDKLLKSLLYDLRVQFCDAQKTHS